MWNSVGRRIRCNWELNLSKSARGCLMCWRRARAPLMLRDIAAKAETLLSAAHRLYSSAIDVLA